MCQAGPDYRRGGQNPQIAIVGACPGANEEDQGRPFIGQAGANLASMMLIINALNANKFPSPLRDDYTLLNAHPLPRYKGRPGYDGKTEPTKADVLDVANIRRLAHQIDGTDITRLLLTGGTSKFLIQTLIERYPDIELFSCGHPSRSAWNFHYKRKPKAEKIRRWTTETFHQEFPIAAIG